MKLFNEFNSKLIDELKNSVIKVVKKRKNKKWNSNCFNHNKDRIVNEGKEDFFL